MANTRASVFDDTPDLDLSAFAPKNKADTKAPSAAAIKAVAETANFRSREAAAAPVPAPPVAAARAAVAPAPAASTSPKREPRRYRTGRNVQFNVKVLQETVDAIYDISEAQDWVLGYTLERAVAALKRELESAT
jgi:hypothetical protein